MGGWGGGDVSGRGGPERRGVGEGPGPRGGGRWAGGVSTEGPDSLFQHLTFESDPPFQSLLLQGKE